MPNDEMTFEEFFKSIDAYMVRHPELVDAIKLGRWYEWALRQMHPIRVFEQRYRDGKLLSRQEVTPDDPEPELPIGIGDF